MTSKKRGFGAMADERQREIASRGGKAAHAKNRAHKFTKEEAREAGRKGGEVISVNKAHMAEIGRKGGQARSRNHAARRLNAARSGVMPVDPAAGGDPLPRAQPTS